MKQQLRFDKTTKIISAVVLLIPIALLFMPVPQNQGGIIIPIITSISLLAIFGIAWLLHPTSYEITNDYLLIHRPLSAIKIALSDISKFQKTEAGFSLRLVGSGGLFGYYGLFTSSKLGRHHRYTGSNEDLVLIDAGKRKYLLSIHDELFYNELIKRTIKSEQ